MELNKEILNTIDGLADRFGLAIDWSKDNIYPQVADVIERFIHYKLVLNWLAVGLGVLFIALAVWIVVPLMIEELQIKKKAQLISSNSQIYTDFILQNHIIYSKHRHFKITPSQSVFNKYVTQEVCVETIDDNFLDRLGGGIPLAFIGIISIALGVTSLIRLYLVPEIYIAEWISNVIN